MKILAIWKRFCPQTSGDTEGRGADRTIKVKLQVATHLASPGALLVDEINVREIFRLWAHDVYLWTGFGTIVGLLARMLMPGKDRAGVLTTVLVGVAGALIGAALLGYFWDGYRLTPLSPIGFSVAVAGASGLLLATNDGPEVWRGRVRQMLGTELAEYVDQQRGVYRAASFVAGELTGCLFIGAAETAPQWDAVKALFATETLADDARRVLLSGRSADGLASAGPIICACFSVGVAAIRAALQAGAATSVEGIGEALRAGTNCGSCLPELKRLVADARLETAT